MVKPKLPERIFAVLYVPNENWEAEIAEAELTRRHAVNVAKEQQAAYGWRTVVREYRLVQPKKRKPVKRAKKARRRG